MLSALPISGSRVWPSCSSESAACTARCLTALPSTVSRLPGIRLRSSAASASTWQPVTTMRAAGFSRVILRTSWRDCWLARAVTAQVLMTTRSASPAVAVISQLSSRKPAMRAADSNWFTLQPSVTTATVLLKRKEGEKGPGSVHPSVPRSGAGGNRPPAPETLCCLLRRHYGISVRDTMVSPWESLRCLLWSHYAVFWGDTIVSPL